EAKRVAGQEPLPGERLGTAGGASRLTDEYWQRQKGLDEAVEKARRELEGARGGREAPHAVWHSLSCSREWRRSRGTTNISNASLMRGRVRTSVAPSPSLSPSTRSARLSTLASGRSRIRQGRVWNLSP